MVQGFHQFQLDIENNVFSQLATSVDFESVTKGRVGNHLLLPSDRGFPLVRTTTRYNIPSQTFLPIHKNIGEEILKQASSQDISLSSENYFNNALIEIYTSEYRKMGYHSDQALDLEEDSYVAIFSCYELGEQSPNASIRRLYVKSKLTNEVSEISLRHNSVLLFSTKTNRQFWHKIILNQQPRTTSVENRWLGITFRQSKTWMRFQEGIPHFENGEALILADEEQRKQFYRLRGQENKNIEFEYPYLPYTISPADILQPR